MQFWLPDGRYLASYVGVYDDAGQPVNGCGVCFAVKGQVSA